MANQQNITLKCSGLYTFQNSLGSMPDGALSETNNVVIDRDGVINPRRGFKTYGTDFGNESSVAKQLMDYKYRIIRHWGITLDVDSDDLGDFTVLNDQDGNPAIISEPVTGTRIRYIEANGNLYFTSSAGIRKISCLDISTIASKPVTPAGMVGALDGQAILNPTPGWFTEDSAVAYRIVWGIKDDNSNVILGAPSERIIISNSLLSLLVSDYNKLVNDLAIVAAVPSFNLTGDTHTSTFIDNITSTTNLSVGMTITGSGVTSGTVIVSISTHSIIISITTSSSLIGTTLTFGQKLHDTDYASLVLPTNSGATTIYAALSALSNGNSNKLDNDIGDQAAQVVTVTAVAGANYQSTGVSDYFTIYSAPNNQQYYVWFQKGTSVDPLVNGAISVQIAVATETATQVAAKIAFALNNTGDFTCVTSTPSVVITNNVVGLCNNPVEFVLDGGFSAVTSTPGITPVFASIPITPSSTPDTPTPTGELQQIQNYFNNIVTALDTTTGISTYARSFIGGAFSSATESATTNVIFTIPFGITISNFYQVYRSSIFTSGPNSLLSDVQPDDELQLIFEGNPTSTEIVNRTINFYDDVADSLRAGGIYLYTNANSGNGIAQANTLPPLARDIAQYKTCTFFANTISNYSTSLGLLTGLGLAGNTFVITQGVLTNTYTFVNSVQQIIQINTIAGSLFTSTATIADYFDIFDINNYNSYRIWFKVTGGSMTPPSIPTNYTLVECDVLTTDSSTQVALALQNILNSLQGFTAVSATNIITVANNLSGIVTAPSEHVTNVGFTITVTTAGTGESISLKQIGVFAASTPAQEIDLTARSLVRIINGNIDENVSAQYTSGPNDLPGLFTLTTKNVGDAIFSVTTNNISVSESFNPTIGSYSTGTGGVANPGTVSSTAHGLNTGDSITITNSTGITPSINGLWIITVIDTNTFSIPIQITGSIGTNNITYYNNINPPLIVSNEVNPNRIFYSSVQQPDAVPIVNFFDVGPKNKNILRILPLRNELFILSEAGVYFLTGDDPTNFQVSLFDSSVWIKAPDSAVVLNNQVFAFTTQGIATISDTGTTIISRPIENKLLPLLTAPYTSFLTATFSVNYDSDRSFLLFTIKNPSDTFATICYRFNVFTNTWTSWDVTKTCGVVDLQKDLLYVGAADTNFIEVERKSFTRLDQADREDIITIPSESINGTILNLGSSFGTKAGDMLVQTQYLTISQFNRLLTKLDSDTSLNQHNYSILNVVSGGNLRTSLTNLAIKLDSDSGLANHTYEADISGFGDTFIDCQNAYNVIITDLNIDPNIFTKNYIESIGIVRYEVLVNNVNINSGQLIIAEPTPLIVGDITRYKQIPTSVTWNSHHFGDASMMKQITESTILFENMDFSEAIASYASDLSPGFDGITVDGEGTGTWGSSIWGNGTWGGDGSSRPIRTFIPVKKQRCRYISGKFTHNNTFELFSIFGISYTFSPISSRGYR